MTICNHFYKLLAIYNHVLKQLSRYPTVTSVTICCLPCSMICSDSTPGAAFNEALRSCRCLNFTSRAQGLARPTGTAWYSSTRGAMGDQSIVNHPDTRGQAATTIVDESDSIGKCTIGRKKLLQA